LVEETSIFVQACDADSKAFVLYIVDAKVAGVAKKLNDDGVFQEAWGSCPKLDLCLVGVGSIGKVVTDLT
jgi:hypothetical protein